MFNFYIQSLCLTILYYSIPSSGLGIKPDIDFIIEKLLSSDKINILIDRVADRAVEKIKSQMKIDTKGRQSQQRYQGKREQKSNVLRNEEGNTKLSEQTTTKRTAYRGQPGKIDIQAVREKYASFPYEQLSLKYKKLISNGKERETTDTEKSTQIYEDKNNFETIMLKPERPERGPMKKEKKHEIITFKSEEKKSEEFDASAVKELKSKHMLEKENKREKALNAKLNENSDDLQLDQRSSFDSKFKARSNEQQKEKQIPSESQNKMFRGKGNRSFKGADSSVDLETAKDDILDAKDDNEQEEGTVEERKEESKIIIRKDGDRVYAVENSPDYEEYNENFEKISKPINNNDDDE